jgi:NAD(P)-dependent dehydrogenase (short-subunit alcohol dehydrogenase family)
MTDVKASDPSRTHAGADWLGLTGSRVLVAGAGGIGAACAVGFLEAGASVFVVDRDESRLGALRDRAAQGGRIAAATFDLTRRGAGSAAVQAAVDALGGVDVLVHTVGINDRRPLLDFTEDEWDAILQANLSTLFSIGQAAGRAMVSQGHGRVIALSSVSGLLAHKDHGPYAASKGGVNQLIRAMAREWAPSSVTVNAVAPGYIETPLTANHLSQDGVRAELEVLVPIGRLGVPAEVVGPVLFLASRHAQFITGHVLYIDGGRTLI